MDEHKSQKFDGHEKLNKGVIGSLEDFTKKLLAEAEKRGYMVSHWDGQQSKICIPLPKINYPLNKLDSKIFIEEEFSLNIIVDQAPGESTNLTSKKDLPMSKSTNNFSAINNVDLTLPLFPYQNAKRRHIEFQNSLFKSNYYDLQS